ncbi:MAG: hypothetical protein AB2814_10455 [Candidatus Sedimenticola endophacoides]
MALGSGVMAPWKNRPSLAAAVARDAPRLAWLAVSLFGLFYLLASWYVMNSSLVMTGVWW